MGVKLQSALGGSVELNAPSTASNFTMTVPTTNGTVATTDQLQNFRNVLINGNFDIWERGATFGLNEYTADRWRGSTGTTGSITRQTFPTGQADVPGNPTFFARFNKTGTGDYALFEHRIEGVRTLSNETATLSFWAKAAAAVTMNVQLSQNFGSGGSAAVSAGAPAVSLTTSWQKFTLVYNLPSISGKTIGSNNFVQLQLLPGQSSTSWTGTVDFAQFQLEQGSVATPFERRPISTELSMCQRYYQSHGNMFQCGMAYGSGTDGFTSNYSFPVTMRAAPTSTVTAGDDGGSGAQLVVSFINAYKATFEVRASAGNDNIVWYRWFQQFTSEL